jgi:hypothetical protein
VGTGQRVEGYEVITSDDQNAGRIVEVSGDNVIVEHGLLRKTRYAVPKPFVHADESQQVVRLSVPWNVVETSPRVEDGSVDQKAVAAHYGLAEGEDAPATEGYGETLPDDPSRSAEQEELRTGVETAPERRAAIREGESEPGPHGRQIIPPDAHEGT